MLDIKFESSDLISNEHQRLSVKDFRKNLAEAFKYTTLSKNLIVLTKNGEERVGLVPLEYIQFVDELTNKCVANGSDNKIPIHQLRNKVFELIECAESHNCRV